MEGTHGQLGTRLTNRLCSHDTHRLTDVDHVTTGQIATVTSRTDSIVSLARDRRTHNDFVDTCLFHDINKLFVKQGIGGHQHFFLGTGLDDVMCNHATEHSLA